MVSVTKRLRLSGEVDEWQPPDPAEGRAHALRKVTAEDGFGLTVSQLRSSLKPNTRAYQCLYMIRRIRGKDVYLRFVRNLT